MVRVDNGHGAAQERDVLDQALADLRMRAHDLPFLGRERSRLQQDRVRNADLADVVQEHAVSEVAQLTLGDPVLARGGQRVAVHAARVGLGADVARVECRAERFQGRSIRRLQLAVGGGEVMCGLLYARLQHRLVLATLDQELSALERTLGGDQQLVDVDRLHDEVVGAQLEALDGGLDVGGAGENDDRGVAVDLTHLLEQLDPGHDGHLEGGHGQRWPCRLEAGHAVATVLGQTALVAGGQEDLMEDLADLAVIVDDQDVSADLHVKTLVARTVSPRLGSCRPSWPRTAPRQTRGTDLRRCPSRHPAGWRRRSWRSLPFRAGRGAWPPPPGCGRRTAAHRPWRSPPGGPRTRPRRSGTPR